MFQSILHAILNDRNGQMSTGDLRRTSFIKHSRLLQDYDRLDYNSEILDCDLEVIRMIIGAH